MSISANIRNIAFLIEKEIEAKKADPTAPTPVGNDVMGKATLAILGGPAEWITYMSLFKSNDAELARLIPTDGTVDPKRQQARAYLVANGTCGTGTGSRLLETVSTDLDI